jgi:hypothetical protein
MINILFYSTVVVTSIVFLFRRRFLAAACYFFVAYTWSLSEHTLLWLKGDRYIFTSGSHGKATEIYNGLLPELALGVGSSLAFVALEDQCRPPADCECWIVFDPAHRSGIEHDIGGWHPPKVTRQLFYSISPGDAYVALVDVKRLDTKAYSVLGCPAPDGG